jgi:hypothetical protein
MLQARKDLVHYWCILLRQKVMLIFWISFLFGKAYFQVMNWNGTINWSIQICFLVGMQLQKYIDIYLIASCRYLFLLLILACLYYFVCLFMKCTCSICDSRPYRGSGAAPTVKFYSSDGVREVVVQICIGWINDDVGGDCVSTSCCVSRCNCFP